MAYGRIGKMSIASHESLLQSPGIWPDPQHFEIMIRLQNQHIRAAEPFGNVIRHVTDIGQLCEFRATTLEREGNGLCGVMRNAEWQDLDIADRERNSSRYRNYCRTIQFVFIGMKRVNRSPGQKCLHRQLFDEHFKSAGMIAVLMRDQYCIDSVGIFADTFKPAADFLAADSCIDEQPHPFGFDESGVAPAAARQHGYGYGHRSDYA